MKIRAQKGTNRRQFLGSSGAAVGVGLGLGLGLGLAAPSISRAAIPTDVDVVIIGAGAAGLAAARAFTHHKISFTCVEARERIGGRAHTDDGIFGVPVDTGCAELHHAKYNPWVVYAQKSGFDVAPLPDEDANTIYDGGIEVSATTEELINEEFKRHQLALLNACKDYEDVSAASTFADLPGGPWAKSMQNWLGPISTGQNADQISTLDWCTNAAGDDWFAPQGFGALIAHYGAKVPVTLNAPVSRIEWGSTHVDVETAKGTIRARTVLITVPVGVLLAEAIEFSPVLPAWKRDVISGMAMSEYLRVLLKLDTKILDQVPGSWLTNRIDNEEGFSFWVDPGGHGVTHAIAGGRYARELELAGDGVSTDAAMQVLADIFGSDIRNGLDDSYATVWSQDPFSRGSWASARPGHSKARSQLAKPVADRLYFAGEADHAQFYGTAGGAAIAGSIVAKRMVDRLNKGQ